MMASRQGQWAGLALGVLSCCTVQAARAQQPGGCLAAASAYHGPRVPEDAGTRWWQWERLVLPAVQRQLAYASLFQSARLGESPPLDLDELWREDSTAVLWGLAAIVTNDAVYSGYEAQAAGALYRHYSGRAGPLLTSLGLLAGHSRRTLEVLDAIRPPLDRDEAGGVLQLACDAVWLQRAALRDSAYWEHRPMPGGWAFRDNVLADACRLLDPARQAIVREALAALPPDWRQSGCGDSPRGGAAGP